MQEPALVHHKRHAWTELSTLIVQFTPVALARRFGWRQSEKGVKVRVWSRWKLRCHLYVVRNDQKNGFIVDGTRSITLLKVPGKGSSFLTELKDLDWENIPIFAHQRSALPDSLLKVSNRAVILNPLEKKKNSTTV